MNEVRYREAERRLWQSVGVAPTERRLHLDRLDTDIRVQETGDGPPIVFVHGGSASGANWASLVAHVDGFRCVLIDRPGCGLSPPLDRDLSDLGDFTDMVDALVVDLVDALELPTGRIVATSMGALFAVRGAAAHPERVERMVTFGYTLGAGLTHVPLSMRIATLPGLNRLMTSIPPTKSAVRAIMRQLGHGPAMKDGRITPEMLGWFLALLRYTPSMRNSTNAPRSVLKVGTKGQTVLPVDVLQRVRCPVRLIWGDADPLGGVDVAERFSTQFADAELEMWPDSGHAPWLDNAELAGERVVDFLGR
jgi:pimeloyl-ACP methyl ester carboxylesterase